jgi:N-acetylmuramoyl-L-alanine amidase
VQLAAYLREALEKRGISADVIDYPGKTNSGDLAETVREINAGQYALCVSLHCDSARRVARYEKMIDYDGLEYEEPVYEDNAGARGAHVIYVSGKGGRAAEAIAAHLCPIMPGRANRTVRRQNLYILNNTRCPAVLVECGFLTNSRDADMLRYEGRRIALAIAVGVEEFLNA